MKNKSKKKNIIIMTTTLLIVIFSNGIVKSQTSQTDVIGDLEVMKKSLGTMNWKDADNLCKNIGEGWRLPNKSELYKLYINSHKIGGFSDGFYWSSTLKYNLILENQAWLLGFASGSECWSFSLQENYNVKAVRTLQENQTKNDTKSPSQYNIKSNPQYKIFNKLKKGSQLPSKIRRKRDKPAREIDTIRG